MFLSRFGGGAGGPGGGAVRDWRFSGAGWAGGATRPDSKGMGRGTSVGIFAQSRSVIRGIDWDSDSKITHRAVLRYVRGNLNWGRGDGGVEGS